MTTDDKQGANPAEAKPPSPAKKKVPSIKDRFPSKKPGGAAPNIGDLRAKLGLGAKPAKRSVSDKFLKEIQEDIEKPKEEPKKPVVSDTEITENPFQAMETQIAGVPQVGHGGFVHPTVQGPPIGLEPMEDRSDQGVVPYKERNIGKLVAIIIGFAAVAIFLMGLSYWFGKAFSYRDEYNKQIFQAKQIQKALKNQNFQEFVAKVQQFKVHSKAELRRVNKVLGRSWVPHPKFLKLCVDFAKYKPLKPAMFIKGNRVWNNKVVSGLQQYIFQANQLLLYAKMVSSNNKAYQKLRENTVKKIGYAVRHKRKPEDKGPSVGKVVEVRSNILKVEVEEPKKDEKGKELKDKKGKPILHKVQKLVIKVKPLGSKFIEKVPAVELVLLKAHELISQEDKRLLATYHKRLSDLDSIASKIYYPTLEKTIKEEAGRTEKFTFR